MTTTLQFALALTCLLFPFTSFEQITLSESFYGQASTNDIFHDIQPTPDGGYIAVGETQVDGQLGDFYVVKFDANGQVEMEETFGTAGIETAYSVALLPDR